MNSLFIMALSNVIVAGLLAAAIFALSRVYKKKPALIHSLWLLVLLKLITPPLFTVPVELPAWNEPVTQAPDNDDAANPATTERPTAAKQADLVASLDPKPMPLPVQNAGAIGMNDSPKPVRPDPFVETKRPDKNAGGFKLVPGDPVKVVPVAGMVDGQTSPDANAAGTERKRTPAITNLETSDNRNLADVRDIAAAPAIALPAAKVAPPQRRSWLSLVFPVITGIWLIGAFLLALWTTIRVMYFRHLLRHTEAASPDLQAEADQLAETMGLSRSPEVRLLPGAVTPMLWAGLGRPQLLFPRELLGRTDANSRAMLLMHELAHMRRGDHWVRFLELLAFCLYWWNPIVWLAKREIHRTEEECCDALVVEHSADCGVGYANALLDTLDFLAESPRAATRGMLPVSGIGRVDFIKQRLTMILSGTIGGRMSRIGRVLVLMSAVVILPLLPVIGHSAEDDSTAAKPPAARGLATKNNKDLDKPKSPRTKPTSPTVGQLEPTDFETRSRTLQFDPLEIRSVDISRDGKYIATGHGKWSTGGMVRVWNFKTKKELHAFPERLGIASVVFSPDSKLLATAGWSESLIIRSTKDFKVLHEIPIGKVARLSFSPDGKSLATATEDNRLQLWNPVTGKELPRLKGTFFRLQTVAFSPDGKYIAVGGGKFDNPQNGRVSCWELKTGKQIKVIEDLRRPIVAVAFAKDGKTLAVGGFDNMVHLYNPSDMSLKRSLSGHRGYVEGVTFSPDGKTVVSTSNDNTVRLWDVASGDQLTALGGHTSTVMCAAYSKDGKTLITGGMDKVLKVWDPTTYREVDSLQPGADAVEFPEPILAVVYSPDGKFVASAHEDKSVRIRDAETGAVVRTLNGHEDVVSQIAWSPDGKTIATASYDKTVKLWNAADGKNIRSLAGHTNWVFSVAFSPDGKQLASSGYDKTIRVWNVKDGKTLTKLSGHFATVRAVAFSPNGKTLVSGSGDRTLKVWDLKTRKLVRTLKGHKGTVRAVAFSPDGETIASAGEDNVIKLWNAADGSVKSTLTGHSGMVWCVAFSPRGQTIASGGFDNRIMIWDPKTGQRRKTLSGHTDVVTSLAFAPDMKGIISGSYDKTLRFWTAKQPPISELLTIAASPQDMRCAAFSDDGRYLAAGGHDRLAKVWDLKTGALIQVLRGHTGGIRTIAFAPSRGAQSAGFGKASGSHPKASGSHPKASGSHPRGLVATGGWDHSVRVWDVATGKEINKFLDPKGQYNITSVAFTSDGKRIVAGGLDKIVRMWDLASNKLVWKSDPHQLEIAGVDVSPDGKTVVAATGHYKKKSSSGVITFWNARTGRREAELAGPMDIKRVEYSPDGSKVLVSSGNSRTPFLLIDSKTHQRTNGPRGFLAAFLPDGKTIAACRGPRRQVFLYDLEAKREVAAFTGHPDTPNNKGTIYNVAVAPDASVFCSISIGGTIKLWPLKKVPALKASMTIQATAKDATRFGIASRNGKHYITGGHDKTVKIWDRKTGKLLHKLEGQKGGITCGALSPDGTKLAVGSWDWSARVWDLTTQKVTKIVLKHKAEVVEIAYTPDGKHIVTSGRDKKINIWDAKTGKHIKATKPQEKPVVTFDISPDGKQIAGVVSDWKTPREPAAVKFWSFPNLEDQGVVYRHRFEMKVAKYSADGRKLVVAGTDMLTVLDVKTRKTVANMPTTTGIMDAAFTDNDRLLVSGDWQGTVIVWNATTGQKISAGRDHNRFIFSIAVDEKTNTVLSAGMDGTLKVWPLSETQETIAERIRSWKSVRPRVRLTVRQRVQTANGSNKLYFAAHATNDRLFAVGDDNGNVRVYLNERLQRTLTGHQGIVWAGQFSPDDSLLATAGNDKTVRIWNVKDGRLQLVMKGHAAKVNSVVFTPDGTQVISADSVGEIRFWDAKTGRQLAVIQKEKTGIERIAISPDGKMLASGGWSKRIELWSLPDRKHAGTLTGHDQRILALAFSPDGKKLVSGDAGKEKADVVKVWDVKQQQQLMSLNTLMSHIHTAAFSPDGRSFATSGADKRLRVWDLATGHLAANVATGSRLDVRNVFWSTDGRRLITASIGGTVRIWNVSANGELWMPGYTAYSASGSSLQLERVVTTHEGGAWTVVWSPDGSALATGGNDKVAVVWDTKTWKQKFPLKHFPGRVYCIRFSPDGKRIALAGEKSQINIYNAAGGQLIHEMKGHEAGVRDITFSPDGKRLVSGSWDKTARVWDVEKGKQLHVCKHAMAAYCVSVSPDNKSFVVGSGAYKEKKDGFVTLWNLKTGKQIKELRDAKGILHGISFYDNDHILVTRAAGAGLSQWNLNTSKLTKVYHGSMGSRFVQMSPDRKMFILTYQSRKAAHVGVWKVGGDQPLVTGTVSRKLLLHAAIAPDGKQFATASRDGSVKLWRLGNSPKNVALKKAKSLQPASSK